jgi:hypothetical protein
VKRILQELVFSSTQAPDKKKREEERAVAAVDGGGKKRKIEVVLTIFPPRSLS